MPKPIIDLIETELIDLLSEIAVHAGDSNTVVVQRADEEGNAPGDRLIIVERGDWREADEVPLNHDGYLQDFNLYAFIAEQRASSVSPSERLASLEADIIKKLNANYTLGGYAHNIFWGQSIDGSVRQLPARKLLLSVEYFTTLNDPYDQ